MISGRFVGTVVVTAALAGCSSTSAQQTKHLSPSDIVVVVESTSVPLAEVDAKAMRMPVSNFGNLRLEQALYEARRAAIDEIVNDLLIDRDAKTRKIERIKLLEQEISSKVAQPSEAEIAAWYEQNQARVQGATLDQVRTPIKSLLLDDRMHVARSAYLDRLRSHASIRVNLEAPRQVVASAGHQSRGPANAPVEVIEFSDFQCPFCLRAYPTVQQVLTTYGDRIHFVYRHYPLPNHPNARPAAEASACAAEQGKFWPFHDRLFGNPDSLGDADLKAAAAQLGLDVAKFNGCVDSRKYKADIEKDAREGDDAGVNGTPAFFINGRLLSGAQPFDDFKRVIDEELAAKRAAK